MISDNADYRKVLRFNIFKKGTINSKLKKNAVDEGKVFENYYDYSELVSHIKPHRMLALNRAEAMDILSVSIEFDKTEALEYLNRKVIGRTIGGVFDQELKDCAADAYKRLIFPSLEREIRAELKEKAEAEAYAAQLKAEKAAKKAAEEAKRLEEEKLAKQKALEEKNISVSYTDNIVNYIIEKGFDEQYGARPMKRVIFREVENKIAELSGGRIK